MPMPVALSKIAYLEGHPEMLKQVNSAIVKTRKRPWRYT